ncbi:MAG: hypothetical protein Q8K85_17010, partial [Hyphomicrobium sp.]|nr:hypothetical protein [Hyphomicrobium sp.]
MRGSLASRRRSRRGALRSTLGDFCWAAIAGGGTYSQEMQASAAEPKNGKAARRAAAMARAVRVKSAASGKWRLGGVLRNYHAGAAQKSAVRSAAARRLVAGLPGNASLAIVTGCFYCANRTCRGSTADEPKAVLQRKHRLARPAFQSHGQAKKPALKNDAQRLFRAPSGRPESRISAVSVGTAP